jgi:hypothetical protein
MMKSMSKLSMIALAAVVCFAPFALGQSTAHGSVASVRRAVPGFLAFAFDRDHNRGGNNGGGNTCGSQGGNEWDKGGKDGWGGGGNNGGGNCQSVPEGGSNLMYLFLASLACFGVLFAQSLRKGTAQDRPVETEQRKQS